MKIPKVLIAGFLVVMGITGYAQLAIVDYMRVKPNNVNDYLELEQTWKKVHEERVKVGLIEGWYLYRIRYTGTDSPYQYATISYYRTFDDSENLYFEGVFEEALKGLDLDSFFVQTENIREFVNSEVFTKVDGLDYDFQNPAKYIYMNFIKVQQGQESNYEEVEQYIWKPIHQELKNSNKMASWSLWNLWFYTHSDYNYITMNEFYEYKDIDSYNYSEAFEKVHKGQDLSLIMKNTVDARTSSKTELWELVDYVVKEN